MLNLAVVEGRLSRSPQERILPSGDRLVSFEVSVQRTPRPTESVPVAWPKAPLRVTQLEPGTHVLVLGRVRRRFFRAAGFTQSRTEVVADAVVPMSHGKKAAKLLAQARALLEDEALP
jgi:single-strand DNA-binding protein